MKITEEWFEPPHDETKKMTVRTPKTHISLGIRPVLSESSLCTQWVAKDPSFLHTDSEDSDQTGRMPRLVWVFAGRTVILLVLSCASSVTFKYYWSWTDSIKPSLVWFIWATSWENIRAVWSAPLFLISAFVVRCLDNIIPLVSVSEISSLYLASLAAQAGLCLTWSQTPKTSFSVTRLNYHVWFRDFFWMASKVSLSQNLL